MTQPAIAEAMGVSLSTVNRAHMAFDRGGLAALEPKRSGGRIRENMTLGEERALLARFAKAAGAGEMVNIHDLKAAYEQAIGHPTSNSTVYNLLARHGWRKLMPRPFHPFGCIFRTRRRRGYAREAWRGAPACGRGWQPARRFGRSARPLPTSRSGKGGQFLGRDRAQRTGVARPDGQCARPEHPQNACRTVRHVGRGTRAAIIAGFAGCGRQAHAQGPATHRGRV